MTSKRKHSWIAGFLSLLALTSTLGSAPVAWSGTLGTPTPTPTEEETETPTPVETETPTPVETETPTPVETETPTPVETETPTPVETETPTPVETETPTPVETETATPEATATSTAPTLTPTPTVTATPEALNHFLCYESHQPSLNRAGVKLEDQFDTNGPSTVTVKKAKRLCAPADKNGEDPTADDDLAHLTAYTIKQTSPKFVRQGPIPVAPDNPILFPMTVTLTRPSRLLVPAAKNLGTTVPDPLAAPIDHYKCYRVKGAQTRLAGVTVDTQFGAPVVVDIKKPIELCTPVDKNGEGIGDDLHHLLCYQVRAAAQPPRTVATTNQFEEKSFDIFGIRELCVPAFKFPGFCGDDAVNAPGEQCDGTADGACPGLCDGTCQCTVVPTCGDDLVNQQFEDCDGTDDTECDGLCSPNCQCPECGNFVIEPPSEECDSFANTCPGPPGPSQECINCQCFYCGDGEIRPPFEQCDPAAANTCAGTSGCDPSTCRCNCGDDNVDPGEDCDGTDSGTCNPLLTCTDDCTCPPPMCGNNIKEGVEECDGNIGPSGCGPSATCLSDCTCTSCGDGIVEGNEECDPPSFQGGPPCGTGEVCATGCQCLAVCFTGDTLVATADGPREIRKIAVGDLVWTADPETGKESLQPVTQTMQRETTALRLIDVGGETIRTTDIHPFWVEGKGWTMAGEIATGDQLRTKEGTQLTVLASTSEPQGGSIMPAALTSKPHGTTTVYDLEVANTHTFFVSPKKILVHNK